MIIDISLISNDLHRQLKQWNLKKRKKNKIKYIFWTNKIIPLSSISIMSFKKNIYILKNIIDKNIIKAIVIFKYSGSKTIGKVYSIKTKKYGYLLLLEWTDGQVRKRKKSMQANFHKSIMERIFQCKCSLQIMCYHSV